MTEPTPRARKATSAMSRTREPEKQKSGGPSRQQVGNVVGTVAGTTRSVVGTVAGTTRWVLQPDHLVYYGALGALAAFEVIEWPVAAAMGVSLIIAERSRKQWGKAREQRPTSLRRGAEPATA